MSKNDYYQTLGVSRDVSQKDLKAAFRKLAVKYHPDKNQDSDAESRFKEISEAYDVLSDSEKRKSYDTFGHEGPGGGFDREDIFSHFSDIFGDFGFGNFSSDRDQRHKRETKGSIIRISIDIDLHEAVSGVSKDIIFKRNRSCNTCDGKGYQSSADIASCSTCNGSGSVTQKAAFMRINMTCPACSGAGKEIKNPCKDCRGYGISSEQSSVNVFIPSGMDSGMRLKLDRMGNLEPGADIPGDAYLSVNIRKHDTFERSGSKLLSRETISFTQAALGTTIQARTIDGLVDLDIPKGTQPGSVFTVQEKGLPVEVGDTQRDTHDIVVQVKVPTELSKDQEKLIKELRDVM